MRGFTLIELLCVIGLLAAVSTFSLPIGISAFRHLQEHFYAQLLSTTVRSARSSSLHKECGGDACLFPQDHGVYVSTSTITTYEGSAFTTRNTAEDSQIPFNGVFLTSSTQEVSFTQKGIPTQATVFTFGTSPSVEIVSVDATGTISVSIQ